MSASDEEEKCDSEREGDVAYEMGRWIGSGIQAAIGVGGQRGGKVVT